MPSLGLEMLGPRPRGCEGWGVEGWAPPWSPQPVPHGSRHHETQAPPTLASILLPELSAQGRQGACLPTARSPARGAPWAWTFFLQHPLDPVLPPGSQVSLQWVPRVTRDPQAGRLLDIFMDTKCTKNRGPSMGGPSWHRRAGLGHCPVPISPVTRDFTLERQPPWD